MRDAFKNGARAKLPVFYFPAHDDLIGFMVRIRDRVRVRASVGIWVRVRARARV